ncbi:MAG TPA: DNA-binding transcriptional regulator [Sedimentisphaerales bacterium]|nr:DNA-binding transcriptional regulator [Sedimentisphaerales bacterium]
MHIAFVVPTLGLSTRRILRGVFRFIGERPSWRLRIALDASEKVLPNLRGAGIDGAFISTPTKKTMSMVLATKMPCIALQCITIPDTLPYLTADSLQVGRLAAEHFLELGYKNFVYYSTGDPFWSRDRMKGFCERVRLAGFNPGVYTMHKKLKAGIITSWRPGRTWMLGLSDTVQWLRALPKPVALMACDDNMAYDLVELAEEAGIRVPEEVAVVGAYNDEAVCLAANPPLSSVAIDLENAGYMAAQLLSSIILKEAAMKGQPIYAAATHVVTRQSSDMLAIEDPDVSAAVHFIRRNFTLPIRVADAVRVTSASRRMLQMKFRHHLNRSITEEITRARVEYVARQLIGSRMSIGELASAAAFDSASHMIRVFKKHMGMPPRTYRKTHGMV